MGIKDGYGIIKSRCPDQLVSYHLSELRGYRLAADISIFAYKTIRTAGEIAWMSMFIMFLCTMKSHGIKLVCIFDGPNYPPEKEKERQRRRAENEKMLARLERAKELKEIAIKREKKGKEMTDEQQDECKLIYGKPRKRNYHIDWNEPEEVRDAMNELIERLERATLPITKEHTDTAKEIITMLGIPLFQADGEAEALCSYMAVHNYVDAVLTEDTDVWAYGTPWMIAFKDYKISDQKIWGIHVPSVREELGYTQDELRDLCILLSCDYNERVKGYPPGAKKPQNIGLARAINMIDEYRTLEAVSEHLVDDSPLNYRRCREIFTPPKKKEVKRLIKVVPLNGKPDFSRIEQHIKRYNLTVTMEYIRKCWQPPVIKFCDGEGVVSGSDTEDDE